MKYKFYSTLKRPELVMKPIKKDKDGQDLQPSVHIRFEDKYFETDDKDKAEFIRNLPNFNTEYFEITDDKLMPKDVGYHGSKTQVVKMDTTQESQNKSSERVDKLEKNVDALTKMVGNILEKLEPKNTNKKTEDKVEDKAEDKQQKTK